MEEDLQKKIDRLVVSGARVTEKGRLDFPNRLPFCIEGKCNQGCIFEKLWVYIKYNDRIGDENCVAIGRCKSIKLKDRDFPYLYAKLDFYSEEVYERGILPIILKFYNPDFMKELFDIIQPK